MDASCHIELLAKEFKFLSKMLDIFSDINPAIPKMVERMEELEKQIAILQGGGQYGGRVKEIS